MEGMETAAELEEQVQGTEVALEKSAKIGSWPLQCVDFLYYLFLNHKIGQRVG